MKPTTAKNRHRHSEETKKKIALSNTGKVFSLERRRNIGKSREIKLSNEDMKKLQEFWSKHYVPERWIRKRLGLGEKVYRRLKKEHCKVEQIQFLPQNFEPKTFENIISACQDNIPYRNIAEMLQIGIKQTRNIILKLGSFYNIKPILQPRYKPTSEHKEKLRQILIKYNQNNPKAGSANGNWHGGITQLSDAIRKHDKYKAWRLDIFERDRFKCIFCDSREDIHADHIKPFCVILRNQNIKTLKEAFGCRELWNINNGRTLCKKCHFTQSTHGRGALKWKDI